MKVDEIGEFEPLVEMPSGLLRQDG
jgi:hypothetical protein